MIGSATANYGWAGQNFDVNDQNQSFQNFEQMNFRDRLLQIVKSLWPECENKDAFWCKDLIDNELAQLNLAEEVKTVIVYKRSEDSPTYNAVSIPLDDNDMCVGRDGDGLLHYDFEWCGSGEKLVNTKEIEESQKLIKPSKWTHLIEKNPNVNCVDGVLTFKNPNMFGGDFDPNACSTLEGYRRVEETVSQTVPVPAAGCRKIGPWDCSGMTGMDACRMIKHLVPDADVKRKQLECWMSYKPGTAKLAETKVDTKVVIFAKLQNNKVIGVPAMQGPVPQTQ